MHYFEGRFVLFIFVYFFVLKAIKNSYKSLVAVLKLADELEREINDFCTNKKKYNHKIKIRFG